MKSLDKQAILIYEIGSLQVLCYQTLEEWTSGVRPKEVYWQKLPECQIRGPFSSIYEATNNYTAVHQLVKSGVRDNVIRVDFKAKKRIL